MHTCLPLLFPPLSPPTNRPPSTLRKPNRTLTRFPMIIINKRQAALNVKVGYHANCGFAYPQFPQWLGKNSTTNKRCVRRFL